MKNQKMLARVNEIAKEKGCSTNQLALAWVISKGAPSTVPIPGTTKVSNLESNIGALGVKLSEKEMKELEAAVPQEDIAGARSIFMAATWQNARTPPLSSWKGIRQ